MAVTAKSLHVGLNHVNPHHYDGWNGQLFACVNDAMFYKTLAEKSGFVADKLIDEEATSEALLKKLKHLADELVEGDMLFLTYCGHGGSLPDLNNDEDDGNDETWCLFDRQVVDDELFIAYARFRAGVRILIFSDSCHSGSVSRAPKKESGTLGDDMDKLYEKHKIIERKLPREKIVPVYKKNKAVYEPILKAEPVLPESIAAYVMLFAACQDNETAKEWGDQGIFTAGVEKAIGESFGNYDELFNRIKTNVPPRLQVPNLFRYGNERFNFSGERPLNLIAEGNAKPVLPKETGKKPAPVSVGGKKMGSKKKEVVNVYTGTAATNLIVHGKNKKIQLVLERRTVTRGAEASGNSSFGIKKENVSIGEAWDKAYQLYLSTPPEEGDKFFVEPDIKSRYARVPADAVINRGEANEYMTTWPPPEAGATEFIWHLDDLHSQLRKAALAIMGSKDIKDPSLHIKIGHIDTGFLDHISKPVNLMEDLGVSFVKDEYGHNNGKDKLNTGFPAEQDGHGCATLAILAGNEIKETKDSYADYKGYFGAIPFAEVIPIRICETVFNLFNANDVADGIDYAVEQGCEVITMSMAGYPTKRVAEAVNAAYEKGVILVTAAGNNWFKGIKRITPKGVMYPARFERVVAATGACFNHKPYDFDANKWFISRSEGGETMQGNWGPDRVMKSAVAAYTPNLPWATTQSKEHKFLRSGGGTSSATPQVAAAMALWVVHNRGKLRLINGTWKKVEAARKAIFRSASKSYPSYKKYYGNGIIRAFDALDNFKFDTEVASLKKSEEANVRFGGIFQFVGQWFRSGSRSDEPETADETLQEMISLEIMQLIYRSSEEGGEDDLMKYSDIIEFEAEDGADFLTDAEARKDFLEALKKSKHASSFLKGLIKE